jgi:hypothetical protein
MTNAVMEHVEYPFAKGNLTSDGIQWSAERDTTTVNVDVEVECVTLKPPALGEMISGQCLQARQTSSINGRQETKVVPGWTCTLL